LIRLVYRNMKKGFFEVDSFYIQFWYTSTM